MGRQIVKQPDGKFAIFSTNSDLFIEQNLTEKELKDNLLKFAIQLAKAEIHNEIHNVKTMDKPYFQFTMTYEECVKSHNENS